ncbi:MAG: L-seryl-tRNA(Sec) selenium transferase [Candidatus Abyssubacteria bacterium]
MAPKSQAHLRDIPSVETIKRTPKVSALLAELSDEFVTKIVRDLLAEIRATRTTDEKVPKLPTLAKLEEAVCARVNAALRPPLHKVINGTGIVVHTNLGRSLLGEKTLAAMIQAAANYCNLEIDLAAGERGHRDTLIEPLICSLTGAEAATVVNNNAAAVMISLDTMAKGREVIVSRGELIEIGGSFRIPDVMARSGAKLVEVGTTNRTYIGDYERALSPETALLLKVHPSNYRVVGFTNQVELAELVELGRKRGIPVMEDLGSGALVDLSRFGIPEPLAQHSVRAGADLVTFSGDKLLGGPQAGIILGKREFIKGIRRNPLMRAFRVDKVTLAGLGALFQALLSSRSPERDIPTLAMIARSPEEIATLAQQVLDGIDATARAALNAQLLDGESQAGGGSAPGQNLPTKLLALKPRSMSPDEISKKLREGSPPILGIIRNDTFCIDFRTIRHHELSEIITALHGVISI